MRRADLAEDVRARLQRLPPPHDSHYGVVPASPPTDSIPLGTALASVEAAQRAMVEAEIIAKELKDPFLVSRILTRKEAISSSAIEGTHSTLDELLSLEEAGADGTSSPTRQVRDYAATLEGLLPRAQQTGPAVFSMDLVRELHRNTMRSDPNYADIPGKLRERVIWIGGTGHIATSTYNPPPPDAVSQCLEENIDYMQCDGMQAMTQGFITRLAIAHAHFEAVHPFRDGNGRVGRLLLPLMMAADGTLPLYLSPYIEANKTNYYEALKAAQQRLDWPSMVGFMADAITGTVSEIKRTRADLAALSEVWRARRSFRADSAASKVLRFLHEYPIVTIGRLQQLLGVSFPAASSAVRQLAEIGVLAERTGYKRNRLFAAEEAIRILNRPFGAA